VNGTPPSPQISRHRFAGAVAVVTGGASGIGRAAAELLIAEGAQVTLVDWNADAVAATADAIGAAGAVVADVSSERDVADYVTRTVTRFGRIDHFVNNAGIAGVRKPITDVSADEFDRVVAVNVRGAFLGLRDVMRAMATSGGGSIVNTSSMGGVRGGATFSPYIASKHAVSGLTRAAALDGAPLGIRVNAVAPGHIDTALSRGLHPDDPRAAEEEIAMLSGHVPLGRFGTPAEAAHLIVWLLSREASYMTGSVVLVDGGLTA